MSITSTTIYTSARALLNDQGNNLYSNTTLEPLLQICLRDLEAKVILEDGFALKASSGLSGLTLAALATTWAAQPTDIIYPLQIEERAVGSTLETDWAVMTYNDILPSRAMQDTLVDWTYNSETIMFVGCTAARSIRLTYYRMIDTVPSAGTITILQNYVTNYLSYHLAELAAGVIGQNADIAQAMAGYAEDKLNDILSIIDKNNQKEPIRRKTYSRKFRRVW